MGWTKVNDDKFENGCHPFQNDDPKTVLLWAQGENPDCDFVFGDLGASQFYFDWNLYCKARETDNE